MPGEIAQSPTIPQTAESVSTQIPTPSKKSGLARAALERIKTAVSAGKNAAPGERMMSFLQALGGRETAKEESTSGPAQSELREANTAIESFPITGSTKKFLRNMNRPSLVSRFILGRGKEKAALLKLQTMETNIHLLSTLIGNEAIKKVEMGQVNLGEIVAARIQEIYKFQQEKNAPYALQYYLGEPSEKTVFPLKRLERALWKDKSTRETAKMLRQMRKANGFTIPRYAWSKKELIAEVAVMEGAKVVKHVGALTQKVLSKK